MSLAAMAVIITMTCTGISSSSGAAVKKKVAPLTTFVIGVPADLTGANSAYDIQASEGAQLAANAVNALHKIHVVLKILDTQSSTQQATIDVESLIQSDKVDALDYAFSSGSVEAAAPIAVKAGVAGTAAVSQATGLEALGPEVLHIAPAESGIYPLLANYAKSCLNVKTAAAMWDQSAAQPVDATQLMVDALSNVGINVTKQVSVLDTESNIGPEATLIVNSNPNAVLINALGTYEVQMVQALDTAGLPANVPIMSGGDMSATVITDLGSSLPVAVTDTEYSATAPYAANAALVKAYAKAYNNGVPDYLVAQSYDAINYLVKAFENAKIPRTATLKKVRADILKSARAIRSFSGTEGTYKYAAPANAKTGIAQPSVPGFVQVIHNGAITETLSPAQLAAGTC
jgi:ABC-type branched-subunit amino acid transport system substrate-binding protein